MTMTRQHFQLIADVLMDARTLTGDDDEMVDEVAHLFAAKLATTNENFDRDRFLKAAGAS